MSVFVPNWNKTHEDFTFSYCETPVTRRPTSVEVRYSASDYQNIYSHNAFSRLHELVREKSHDTMYITTDVNLLKKGVIEIKVASNSPNYREKYIVDTLKGINEEFLRHRIAVAS